ncbi:TonB-dependent receptor domain-containing protein [Bacteroides acidifaciens]|uniref:TonB-dependent receptor domain-containing protein n=1 Tax=Bacteroides acidifaciens TaxID=85831 RepID=UPI002575616F|nr:TonB-dependent receptor [Bacteroides acidifaciens]
MIRKLITLLLITVVQAPMLSAFAQEMAVPATTEVEDRYSVKCKVIDKDGEPEIYATYRIYSMNDTTKTVCIGTTAIDGGFIVQLPNVGDYILYVSVIGKDTIKRPFSIDTSHPVADLGILTSEISNTQLDEVVVVAQKPLISKEIDRIGYDVQADEGSKTNTVIEMLRKVPMVAVDGENQITVNGSSNFKIFKNGRPSNSYTNNAKDILAGMPASMVKRIEVITEPGAKYDAEGIGAIINIVMIEAPAVKGVMGTATLGGDTNGRLSPSLWLASQINKVTFSVNGGFVNLNEKSMTIDFEENSHYVESGNIFQSKSNRKSHGHMGYFGGEASYELDPRNLFTAEFDGFIYGLKPSVTSLADMKGLNGNTLYNYSQSNIPGTCQNKYFSLEGGLNYQHNTHRQGEIIGVGYLVSTKHSNDNDGQQYSELYNFPLPYTEAISNTTTDFIEHTFQFDYTRPIGNIHTIEVGSKYILRNNNSKGIRDYVDYQIDKTDFSHITNIGALYAQYGARVKAWSFRAGIRYEYSNLKAKFHDGSAEDFSSDFNDIVPSAGILWQASAASNFSLNYSSRINRPGIEYLNPEVTVTPTTLSYGNPDLSSVRNNSMKFTYMLMKQKVVFNATAGFDWADNGIVTINYVDKDGIIRNTFGNVGEVRKFSLSSFVQWSPGAKTRLMLNATVSYDRYRQSGMSLGRWKKTIYANLTQKLPWKLSGELMIMHMDMGASNVYSYTEVPLKYSIMANATLRRSFLKEDRLTVSLNFLSPIGGSGMKINTHTVNGGYTGISSIYQHNVRMLKLSIAYRFGSLKSSVKKTEKTIENDDLIGGKSADTGSGIGM